MTMALPVQEFQIGQRVRRANGEPPYVISVIMLRDGVFYYGDCNQPGHSSCAVTLAPERLPYVPSERLVVVIDREERTRLAYLKKVCRCETDAELAARHAAEWAKYDAQGDEA